LPSERAIFLFVDKMVPQSRSVFWIFSNLFDYKWIIWIDFYGVSWIVSNSICLVGQWVNCIPNIRTLTDFFTLPILEKTLLETTSLTTLRLKSLPLVDFFRNLLNIQIFPLFCDCDRYRNLIHEQTHYFDSDQLLTLHTFILFMRNWFDFRSSYDSK
jgi:hypothetical protein